MPDTPSDISDDVLTQLVTGPSIREVASTSLHTALGTAYPQLHIDPNLTMVVSPVWTLVDDQVIAGRSRFESLTDVLVWLGLSGTTVTYIDGEHFLTRQSGVEPAIQLPVKIDAIGCLLNRLARRLFVAYQEQQLEYWNRATPATPRWHQLRDALHTIWNVDTVTGWDEDQRKMALTVYEYPDKSARAPHDKYETKACLIDIDGLDNQTSEHLRVLDVAVLVSTLGERTLVVTHSIAEGFRRYDSLASLGETLARRIDSSPGDRVLQWRLYEPTGNFFDHQAHALIALEIDAIGSLGDATAALTPSLGSQVGAAAKNFADFHEHPSSRLNKIQHLLPDWLANAPPADLTRYSRHLMDLALLREQDAGKSFDEGIASLPDFALQALIDQMIKDKKISDQSAATSLKLKDIEVSITSVVVLGTVIVPGKTQTLTLSLVDLALQNLLGMPLGNKAVQYKNGEAVPAWMTPAYLEELVTQVNIGETYPNLIKSKLLGHTEENSRRQKLYASQLRIQLPLMALQLKIRAEGGIDEHGYRYVVAATQENATDRYVDGLEIIIRPLAFIPGGSTDSKADEVANMFVIGPRLADKGPCLLFRPLLDHPLIQYPGEANMLYAIKHNKALRQSVLAWLPDDVYFNYSQYVFPGQLPSVWTLSQWLTDPTSALGMMGTLTLSATPVAEPSLQALFTANANAMITLADRQSVSNAERRWATLKQGAWMLFNIALPFLGRTGTTAAWIWQIMDDLHEANEAREANDSDQKWTALTDLFLSLGMVLAHHAATRNSPVSRVVEKVSTTAAKPVSAAKVTMTQLADLAADHLPANHETSVYTKGTLAQGPLATLLEGLAITKPSALKEPSTAPGPHRFLSPLNQKWYARVGQRWFEVTRNDNDDVQIIDSRQTPATTGPLLIHSAKGEWFIDTRLRLRGGGKGRKEIERKNQQRKDDLKRQLTAFDGRKLDLKAKLEAAEKTADTHRQPLIETLNSQLTEYGAYIEQLKSYNAIDPIPNYRPVMVSCLDYQLSLTQKWFNRQNKVFGEHMRQSLALLDNATIKSSQTPRQTHQLTSDMTQGFIDKIEFAHARIDELLRLGKEGAETAGEFKAQLPTFDLHDLKLFQISLAQELCLNDSGTLATPQARQAMQRIVEDAGLTIQSSLDLAAEDNALALPERIDGFSDLVEQFETLGQRIVDLPDEFTGQLLQVPLDLMHQRIEAFKAHSVRHLANLLHERKILEPTPGPSRPAPAPSRIIKTHFKGTVVGKLRARAAADDTDLIDVTSPLSGKVIATFHEKTPGVWLEHVPPKPRSPTTLRPDLGSSIQTGQSLLDQLEPFTRRTEAHANRAGRIPVEIEEIFHQQASRMEEAAEAIEQALTDKNATDSGPGSAVNLAKQLNEGATTLYEKGRLTRIRMTKLQPPTAARVEWLHSKGLVNIVKTPGRSRLKGHRKDYLEEYEIRDSATNDVIWYAHFHYPKPETAAEGYTAAHLKTVSQRTLGGAFDLRTATTNNELIAIYRSEISPQLAKTLFLSKTRSSASGS
ncbi:dermonecrotic toxin domain-containing protein [Pseudomonas sp. XS1P51]